LEEHGTTQPAVLELGSDVHRHLGLIHGLLANQSKFLVFMILSDTCQFELLEPSDNNMNKHLGRAFFHYQQAINLKPEKWEYYYQASLQRAENREVHIHLYIFVSVAHI
jgi:hypothetical protein